MPDSWLTIAPVRNLWRLPEALHLPYSFDDRTSLRALPEWVLSDAKHDPLRAKFGRAVKKSRAKYCVTVEYQADALGSPDPTWRGKGTRSIQEWAVERVQNVLLAFWLVRRTSVTFREVAHFIDRGTEQVTRHLTKYDALCPLPTYIDEAYDDTDFERVRVLFRALTELPMEGTLKTAAQSTARALTEQSWTMRFLILWLVLESLFGPEDGREITFRISQRIALFLHDKRGEAAETLFGQMKSSYGWRSKLVHGLRLAKLTDDQSRALIVELEETVNAALVRILSSEMLVKTFDTQGREKLLDGLVF